MIRTIILLLCINVLVLPVYAQSTVENHLLYSSHLQESRMISVALPSDYEKNDKAYPVLYVLDGEYIFDYAKGTVDFLTNEFGHLPNMIVVSIPNTDRGRDMYVTLNEEDAYNNFVAFLKNEVFPFIKEKYRIGEFEILYGWSSGSSICTYMLMTEPDLIQGYILTGSGIGKRSSAYMRELVNKDIFRDKTFLYVNTEQGPREPGLRKYQAIIDSIQPNNLMYKFEVLEQSHVEVMHTGLATGLKYILADFYIPTENCLQGFDAILSYYKAINSKYNIDFEIPVGAINESAGILYYNDKKEDAIKLLNYGVEIHPHSAALYGSLAEIHIAESKPQLAKEYYKKALDLSADNMQDFIKYKTLMKGMDKH